MQEYRRVDLKLNEVYQEILTLNKSNKVFLMNLTKAQRLWVQFRDAQLDLKYPPETEPSYYKSVIPMLQAMFLTELTIQRIKELEELMDQPVLDRSKNPWVGIWYGNGSREFTLLIQERSDSICILDCKGPNSEWEGFGYDFGNELIAIFRYKNIDHKGYFTLTLSSPKRAEFSSYNSDGSYRTKGYYIKD